MSVGTLLSCLDKVKRTGDGRWMACCPHHADRSPSLAITELSDGRILLHCFAGCPPNDVLASVGMTFADVMPERLGNYRRERRPFNAYEVLEALAYEIRVARLIAADMHAGREITPSERQRLGQAASRIAQAEDLIHGR